MNRDEGHEGEKNKTSRVALVRDLRGKPCSYKSQVESRSTGDWHPWRELIKEEFEFELAIVAFLRRVNPAAADRRRPQSQPKTINK